MTWIKICGTTNLEDAQLAVEAGADALGFVFYEKSPRKIGLERAKEIVEILPADVEKVGVFVEHKAEQIDEICDKAGFTAVQVRTDLDFAGMGPILDLKRRRNYHLLITLPAHLFSDEFSGVWLFPHDFTSQVTAVHLDSATLDCPGGSGKSFDWERAAPLVHALSRKMQTVVAGGLTPSNVAEAIRILEPWGVDVASGVEARPGKKDPGKVRAFIQAVRAAEKNN